MPENFAISHAQDRLLCAGLPFFSGLPEDSRLSFLPSGSLLLTVNAASLTARAVLPAPKTLDQASSPAAFVLRSQASARPLRVDCV